MFFGALLVVLGLFLLPVTTAEQTPTVGLYTLVWSRERTPFGGIFVMTQILPNHANRFPTNPSETNDAASPRTRRFITTQRTLIHGAQSTTRAHNPGRLVILRARRVGVEEEVRVIVCEQIRPGGATTALSAPQLLGEPFCPPGGDSSHMLLRVGLDFAWS